MPGLSLRWDKVFNIPKNNVKWLDINQNIKINEFVSLHFDNIVFYDLMKNSSMIWMLLKLLLWCFFLRLQFFLILFKIISSINPRRIFSDAINFKWFSIYVKFSTKSFVARVHGNFYVSTFTHKRCFVETIFSSVNSQKLPFKDFLVVLFA